METILFWGVGLALVGGGFACLVAVVLGLPGAWILLGLAVAVELVDGLWVASTDPVTFGLPVLVGCGVAAGAGEGLEFLAGVLGARQAGSSRRGMVGALLGGLGGLFLGVFLPIPIVGSLVGGLVGCFSGALLGELSHAKVTVREAIKPALGALVGKVLGTLAKVPILLGMWGVLLFRFFVG
jgi:uncharacterized protein YqgC (DUF456 family)